MTEETNKAIVIDSGSGFIKAGLASDECPSAFLPNIYAARDTGMGEFTHVIGADVMKAQNADFEILRPIRRGKVEDLDGLERIWQHTYLNQLRLDSTEHPLLTSCYPDENKLDKENTAMIFFETFGVPGYYCMNSGLLSLYGSGKTTGLVIESGSDVTTVTPVHEGVIIPFAHCFELIGGTDLDSLLLDLLRVTQPEVAKRLTTNHTSILKEQLTYIASDFEMEVSRYRNASTKANPVTLPDGTIVDCGLEAIIAGESIFNPQEASKFLSKDQACSSLKSISGLSGLALESLFKVEAQLRKDFWGNIILSGGNSLFKGLANRLSNDLLASAPPTAKVRIHNTQERQFLSWTGGSILTSIPSFQSVWMTQGEYQEFGPSVVYRKGL
jgi:actin, other eukaryote